MEDSILPPSLPVFFPDSPTSDNEALSTESVQSITSGVKELSIQTNMSKSNLAPVNLGFLEVQDRGKESPVSPTSNKLKRTAAIRVNKIPINGLRKGPVDKHEQRKVRSRLLRRSLSLNDTEAILEQVSTPSDQSQEASHKEEMKHRRRQLRRSKSFSEERNSGALLEQSASYEEDQLDVLDDQTSDIYSPVQAPQELEESLPSHSDSSIGTSLGIQLTNRPMARRSRSFNVVSTNTNKNVELLRTYSSHSYREREPNPVYSEGPLGFYSQKFNATQEPARDRISGIMKSWKTDKGSDDTLLSSASCFSSDHRDISPSDKTLDLISSLSRKLSAVPIKFHKPKVSRLVIQNPSESRALFQPTVPEQLMSDSTLRDDEYQGVFPPSKEIKASRVQFNTRSSLEMRLTKEKLCSVIVEDITERKLESNTDLMQLEAPPEIVYPRENVETVKRSSISQISKAYNQTVDPLIPLEPSLSPFLAASRKDPLHGTEQEEYSPSPISPSDIGPSFFLTALTDRLKLPFSLEGLDLSVSPSTSPPLNSTLFQESEESTGDSPILQPCSLPVRSSGSFENDEYTKCTPTTPIDDITTDTSIEIVHEDNRSCGSYSTASCPSQPNKVEAVHNTRSNIPYIKRFSVIESAGVVKGILPHLKKKKPHILGPSNSFRRKSRRIAPQFLHIDTNIHRRSLIQSTSTPTETASSNESITSCPVSLPEASTRTRITQEEATSSADKLAHKCSIAANQNLDMGIQPITPASNPVKHVAKSKEIANFTKEVVNATKNIKSASRSMNEESKCVVDSSIESSVNRKPSTIIPQPAPDAHAKGPNKAKETEMRSSNNTRSVIHQGPALQIINSNAVKNRYLILMDDLLIVAKPISREGTQSYTLNSRFMVKHIIELSSISFTASREKERHGRKAIEDGKGASSSRNHMGELHPLIASTVRRFNMNPYEGIMYMIDKGALRADPHSISTFLHKTPELSRKQIGKFLGMPSNHAILNSFLDRFKFAGIHIDDALRVFLAAFRLPGEGNVIDYLVGAFARRWHRANAHYVAYDVETAIKLVFFMMALNADLHNRKPATKAKMELVDFVDRFRAMDATSSFPESRLIDIYQSIRQDKLETAMDDRDYQPIPIETRFPSDYHLVINDNSARLTVTIPVADRDLRIKPVGDGLICDIPVLDFTYTNSITFSVKATSLGRKSLAFIKLGARNRKYSSIPAWSLVVEPPFMQHTFQVGFPGETSGQPRKKFMFGVESATDRTTWLEKITTTFANTFNHTNPELEMILRRLRGHLISEDSTHSLILTGHELVQCLQAPITSTTPLELRASMNMKYPKKMPTHTSAPLRSQPSHPTSNKLRPNIPALPSNHSRGRNQPSGNSQQVYNQGSRKTGHVAISNPSNSRPNYQIDPNSTTMTTGGAKFRIRAG